MKIVNFKAREVLDSRGNPTIAVTAYLDDGTKAEAMVPSGASTGKHEAVELRDNDKKKYGGKGVLKACINVEKKILPLLKGKDAIKQREIDNLMIKGDGTKQKSNFGANAILGVSLAMAQAVAKSQGLELFQYLRQLFSNIKKKGKISSPKAMMNFINGGVHADNGLSVQEFMVVPQQKEFKERIRCGAEVFQALKKILQARNLSTSVGDEGGFAPALQYNEQALLLLTEAVEAAGYRGGKEVNFALDIASSEFFKGGLYNFDGKIFPADEMIDIYESWLKKYPIISIEDGMAEDDWEGWKLLTQRLGKKIILVGDDLFVTNCQRLQKGIREKVANAILIKPNQIGTLSETFEAIELAGKNDYKVIISHRSGETEDTTIADLAVAVNADFIKTGSICRSERVAKYNRLLQIERQI